jgi:NAD(P)H-dependent FMN reductase
MNNKLKITLTILMIMICLPTCSEQEQPSGVHQSSSTTQPISKKIVINIIMGTTRQDRKSEKITLLFKKMADKRTDIITEILDLKEYNLPFLNDEIFPYKREKITDPLIQKWSDRISQADAYIIVVPEYNAGYPGVLKNALDILYKEWNNKPVGFIGYSGGSTGGSSAIAQLRTVANAFKMIPVSSEINIPHVWKAFDDNGNFINKNLEAELHVMINQIINACL